MSRVFSKQASDVPYVQHNKSQYDSQSTVSISSQYAGPDAAHIRQSMLAKQASMVAEKHDSSDDWFVELVTVLVVGEAASRCCQL